MIGEVSGPRGADMRPQPAPIKSTLVSFTCAQCHHLQQNSVLEYTEHETEIIGACFCDNCGFRPFKLGHQSTFFSMSSQQTEPEMKEYYRGGNHPQHSRKYDNREFTESLQAVPSSEADRASYGQSQRGLPSGNASAPSSHRLSMSREMLPPETASTGAASARGAAFAPPTAAPDISSSISTQETHVSRRHSIAYVLKILKQSFRLGRRPRSENVDHDRRAADANANRRPKSKIKHRLWKRKRTTATNTEVGLGRPDLSPGSANVPPQAPSAPTPPASGPGDTTMEEQGAARPSSERESREASIPARREHLTIAAQEYGQPQTAFRQRGIHAVVHDLTRDESLGRMQLREFDLYTAGMVGNLGDRETLRPASLNTSDLGISRAVLESLPRPPSGTLFEQNGSRRSSGSNSNTLLNSTSSQRGSSRGRTRRSYNASSTIGRSPLSSSPGPRPGSAGELSASARSSTRPSARPSNLIDTSYMSNHVGPSDDDDDEDDDGGQTPRPTGHGVHTNERNGPSLSIPTLNGVQQQQQEHAPAESSS